MNIKKIYEKDKKDNEGYLSCDLSNFESCCNRIQQSLDGIDLEAAVDNMCALTSIFKEATNINYNKYRIKTKTVYERKFIIPTSEFVDSKTLIQNDFDYARNQIKSFIEQNYKSGEFFVSKKVLKLPYWCVDWRYYNQYTERFVKICRKVDEEFGLDKTNKNYESTYRNEYNALDVYFSRYNQRCYLKFASISDAKKAVGDLPTEYGEYNEENGTIWVDVPFSC